MSEPLLGFRELPRWTNEELAVAPTQPGTVSFVIPAFNAEKTLLDALTSCQHQTRHVDEIVVVEDGSTDRTWELLGGLVAVNCRVRCKRQGRNLGVSAARNHGARLAAGEFIIYLDADDLAPPDRVEQSLAEFAAGADVVYGQKEYFAGTDFTKRRRRSVVELPTVRNILGSGFGASTVAVRRSVHLEHGIWWNERMSVAEDAEFLIACMAAGLKVCCSGNVYCWVRERDGSLRHRGDWGAMRRYMAEKHHDWLNGFYKGQC